MKDFLRGIWIVLGVAWPIPVASIIIAIISYFVNFESAIVLLGAYIVILNIYYIGVNFKKGKK